MIDHTRIAANQGLLLETRSVAYRRSRCMLRADLAKEVGVSEAAIINLERGIETGCASLTKSMVRAYINKHTA